LFEEVSTKASNKERNAWSERIDGKGSEEKRRNIKRDIHREKSSLQMQQNHAWDICDIFNSGVISWRVATTFAGDGEHDAQSVALLRQPAAPDNNKRHTSILFKVDV
jgi:hypothetical protein